VLISFFKAFLALMIAHFSSGVNLGFDRVPVGVACDAGRNNAG
jgi:hypothetical protein